MNYKLYIVPEDVTQLQIATNEWSDRYRLRDCVNHVQYSFRRIAAQRLYNVKLKLRADRINSTAFFRTQKSGVSAPPSCFIPLLLQ